MLVVWKYLEPEPSLSPFEERSRTFKTTYLFPTLCLVDLKCSSEQKHRSMVHLGHSRNQKITQSLVSWTVLAISTTRCASALGINAGAKRFQSCSHDDLFVLDQYPTAV